MTLKTADDFDLKKIAESGQCFRWSEAAGGGYIVQAADFVLIIKPEKKNAGGTPGQKIFSLSCTEDEWEAFWKNYFDMNTDYAGIRAKINIDDDPYLFRASGYGAGIRILRQDPWEMLITFIISQRKSIPAIKTCVEKLCRAAGSRIPESPDGEKRFAFPTAEAVCALPAGALASCGLGYRAEYVAEAARTAAEGGFDIEALNKLDDDELVRSLMKFKGVGIKVASCVALFGFHRLNAFPKDVWILRTLGEHYPDGFPFEEYSPYAGVMQQYLFFMRRHEG